jgi:hypothetical protein
MMIKSIRKFLANFKHWHRYAPYQSQENLWGVKCSCGIKALGVHSEKSAREIAWKSNVHNGNLRANYIANGVVSKADPSNGIKL